VTLKSGSKVKVIGTDTDRSATYDFLLVTVGLSRTVSEINCDFHRKSQIFLTPVYRASADGVPLRIMVSA